MNGGERREESDAKSWHESARGEDLLDTAEDIEICLERLMTWLWLRKWQVATSECCDWAVLEGHCAKRPLSPILLTESC